MGIELEVQDDREYKEVKARELQLESVSKLQEVSDMVDNINIDVIESNTETIKEVVVNNLENQTNLDDIVDAIQQVSRGISDIKRSQTNLNKKINELQDKIGE